VNDVAEALIRVLRLVIIVLASAIFAVVIAAVVARYGVGGAVSWTEEVPRYLLIWISFLGAAICVDRKEHIAFEVLFTHLPPGPRRVVMGLIDLLILVFGFVMFWYGIVFVADFGSDTMETLPYKNYWYYTAMPISGLLIVLFTMRSLLNSWLGGAVPGDRIAPTGHVGLD